MKYKFNNALIHYEYIFKEGKEVVIFLHGWGRNGEDFQNFISIFDDYSLLMIDFPPFGKSVFSPQDFSIFSYANMVISLCEHLKISSANFIGHSFGGRICMILSALYPSLVHKCIYIDSAGLKPRRSIKYHYKVAKFKIYKRLGKSIEGGSSDYKALSPEMKGLFKNIVNTHLDDFAKEAVCPSLIVWGEKDKETPLYMAKRLNRLISSSELKVIKNVGHFSFLESPLEFSRIAVNFLKEN